ncbi:MAG: cyclic nucleotide-binding domain-containing protein [Thermodesulfobacteriota bacterium]|nr:cyclic nucleotide-binding domain-containing protein [Thermodesulfobacteriota bacterium]
MAQIELTGNEIEMLREILKKQLSELSLETAFTHRKDFLEFLKRRKAFIEGFIQRLEGELTSGKREVVNIDRLRKVDILQGLTEGELQSIAQFFEEENVAAGVILCKEGGSAERLYVLEQGRVSISSKKSGQYDIDTPGKIVGWSFLVPPFLYTGSAITVTPSKVLVIKSPDFYYVLHKEPKMGMKVINNLAQVIASRLKGQVDPF